MPQIDLDPSEWTREDKREVAVAAISSVTTLFISLCIGLAIGIARGDITDVPAIYIVPVALGAIAVVAAVILIGHVTCKAWDWMWAKVKAAFRASR